jgi:hypothetical protein
LASLIVGALARAGDVRFRELFPSRIAYLFLQLGGPSYVQIRFDYWLCIVNSFGVPS